MGGGLDGGGQLAAFGFHGFGLHAFVLPVQPALRQNRGGEKQQQDQKRQCKKPESRAHGRG